MKEIKTKKGRTHDHGYFLAERDEALAGCLLFGSIALAVTILVIVALVIY